MNLLPRIYAFQFALRFRVHQMTVTIGISGTERKIEPRRVSALQTVVEVVPTRGVVVECDAARICGFLEKVIPVGRAVVVTVDPAHCAAFCVR